MKLDDIIIGSHKVGVFTIGIQYPVFTSDPQTNYFEVLVTQRVTIPSASYLVYVSLVEDERFDIFKHLGTYSRRLTEEDLVEYNSHTSSVFHQIRMTTFKLSRHSIVTLFETCAKLTKKLR